MLKRITIVCSEEDQCQLEELFNTMCPFANRTNECNENSDCGCCVEDNIKFVTIESEVK